MAKRKAKNALVLTGGSIRGAFQAGAIGKVLAQGYEPDYISGVSVGALNGGLLWKLINEGKDIDRWYLAGQELINFWLNNVKSFEDIGRKRCYITLAWDILRGGFKSVLDMSRLEKMVEGVITGDPWNEFCDFSAGVVNIDSSKYESHSSFDYSVPSLIPFILASTKIPIMMELKHINGNRYYDGGIRNIAPLKEAIDRGADNIVVIACQPRSMEHLRSTPLFKHGNVIHLIDRFTSIMTNEILNNDLSLAEERNEEALNDPSSKYRKINIKVYRPPHTIPVEIDKFKSEDIADMLLLGGRIVENDPLNWRFVPKLKI